MGRTPNPPGMQAAKGNPGKRKPRKPVALPLTTAGKVRPPPWLRKSRAALLAWNEIAPLLEKLNALTQLDAFPLARYCRMIVQWKIASEAVDKEGSWFDATDTNGAQTKRRHPALQASLDLDRRLCDLETAFGMRPDARFKMMRDQAAMQGMPGLFDDRPNPELAKVPAPAESDDPIGFLTQNAGQRPN